ncbi:hypothetical protein ABZ471_00900 [Streptomyces sp. NPDC005728]
MSETKTPALQYRFDGPEDAPVLILGPSLGTTWHGLQGPSRGVHTSQLRA